MIRLLHVCRLFYKHGQIIFIDLFLFVIVIIPDKAAVFPGLRDRGIPYDLRIFIYRIEIEDKDPLRKKVIIDQSEGLHDLLLFQQIVDRIADTDHGADCTVQFKCPHVLQQIEDIQPCAVSFLYGNLQHLLRVIYPDHIIALCGQKLRQRARTTAQIQNGILLLTQILFYDIIVSFYGIMITRAFAVRRDGAGRHRILPASPVFLQQRRQKAAPLLIGRVIHKCIVYLCKSCICFHGQIPVAIDKSTFHLPGDARCINNFISYYRKTADSHN